MVCFCIFCYWARVIKLKLKVWIFLEWGVYVSLHFFACPKKRSKESAPRTPTLATISHKAALLGLSPLQFAPFVDACPGVDLYRFSVKYFWRGSATSLSVSLLLLYSCFICSIECCAFPARRGRKELNDLVLSFVLKQKKQKFKTA